MITPTLARITKRLPKFQEFLTARGAEVLANTNEWEVIRFRAAGVVSVVYRNKSDGMTFDKLGGSALDAFFNNMQWSAGVATPRKQKQTATVNALLKRDGENCFLCRKPLGDDITEEHLVPVIAGGPNHIANKALAHSACNQRMGHLSLMEKIALRDKAGQP